MSVKYYVQLFKILILIDLKVTLRIQIKWLNRLLVVFYLLFLLINVCTVSIVGFIQQHIAILLFVIKLPNDNDNEIKTQSMKKTVNIHFDL